MKNKAQTIRNLEDVIDNHTLDKNSRMMLQSIIEHLKKEPDDDVKETSANAKLTGAGRVALLQEVLSSPVFSGESNLRSKLEYLLADIRGNTVDWKQHESPRSVPVQQWDYATEVCAEYWGILKILQDRDNSGWETLSFTYIPGRYAILFKRPKQ